MSFAMSMLYDSDAHIVVYVQYGDRIGYEIVDKEAGDEVFLSGTMAEDFTFQRQVWAANEPTKEEVELRLIGYCALARLPLRTH
jgi:hypothetical protein